MARITDPEKLERIKQCTMELIVENGYQGVTIANIATRAKVSAGYLYRYFKGKNELINFLVEECFNDLRQRIGSMLDEGNTVGEVVRYYFGSLFEMANTTPARSLFLAALVHDASFRSDIQGKDSLGIQYTAGRILEIGRQTGEISSDIRVPDALLFLMDLPLNYILHRLISKDVPMPITEADTARLAQMCLHAFRP